MAFDPLRLDQELRSAARDLRRFERSLRSNPNALRRFELSPRLLDDETMAALRESSDPLSPALARWLEWLRERAAESPIAIEQARAYRTELVAVDTPIAGRYTLRSVLGHALAERAARSVWLATYVDRAGALASATSKLWARRAELGYPERRDPRRHTELASEWLALTADMFGEFAPSDLATLVDRCLGPELTEGWPSRISARSISELLREARWFDGLSLDPDPLPETISAASFVRALSIVGRAWAEAAPQSGLFALSRDPYAELESTYGELFAGLPLSAPFARRRLGLGAARIRDHLRGMARLSLFETRARAFRVLLHAPALSGSGALGEAFVEHGFSAFGFELPKKAAGTLWQPRLDDPERFAAVFWAAAEDARLIDTHDDDWFRNPRAVEELRARAQEREPTLTSELLTAGRDALLRTLKSALA